MSIDEEVLKKLDIYAHLCNRWIPDVFDGLSGEDLPMEVLTMYYASPNRLGWDPTKGPLDKYLIGILNNKLKDHLRREKRTAGSWDDPNFSQKIKIHNIRNEKLLWGSKLHTIEPTELLDQLLQAANGDPALIAVIKAAQDIDEGHNINQQLADQLGITPEEIVNRKKRLVRKYQRMFDAPTAS